MGFGCKYVCVWHKVTMFVFTFGRLWHYQDFINVNEHWHKIKFFDVLCLTLLLVDLHRCIYWDSKSCVCHDHRSIYGQVEHRTKINIYGSIYGQEVKTKNKLQNICTKTTLCISRNGYNNQGLNSITQPHFNNPPSIMAD